MHQIIFIPELFSLSILSEYGTILKALSTTNKSLHGCYLEELRILPEGQIEPIKSLQILQSDRSLFVGLDDRLMKIPLERCSTYPTERYNPYQRQACNVDFNQTSNFSLLKISASCIGFTDF